MCENGDEHRLQLQALTRGEWMGVAWRYWQWVKLDPARGRAVVPLVSARDFFCQQFGGCADDEDINDKACQIHLMQQWQHSADPLNQRMAEVCLRCFISYQIDWVCKDLAQKFADEGGFDHGELLALVLDDVSVAERMDRAIAPLHNASLATRILESFDPHKAQLSTWCRQMVVSHPDLTAFLKSCGIALESDWSLLNNIRPEQLRRILQQYEVSSQGIEQGVALLLSYQAVYRSDRLQQLQTQKIRGRCRPPTPAQLDRILAHLQSKGGSALPPELLLKRLQALAHSIRQARRPQTVTLDHPNLPTLAQPEPDPQAEAENIFLQQYRALFETTLVEAIAQVVENRVAYRQRKRQPNDRPFLLALHLLHCQGKSMGEIAAQVNLKQQYQVSRLLELKELRADVRTAMLVMLGDRIRELAANYVEVERLQQLDTTLDGALEAEVDAMIVAAEKEATTAQSFRKTVFSQVLCHYLDTRSRP